MSILSRQVYCSYFAFFLYAYTSVIAVYHLTGFGAFKSITNMMAVATVFYTFAVILYAAFNDGVSRRYFLLLSFVSVVLVLHIIINFGRTDYIDLLKFYSLFLFSFIGLGLGWNKFIISRPAMILLFSAPLIVELLGGSRVYYSGIKFGYFPNKNTAVLYYSVITAIFLSQSRISDKYAPCFIFLALLFQKLGALLSVSLAILYVYIKTIARYLPLLAVSGVLVVAGLFSFGVFDRVLEVVDGLYQLYSYNSFIEVADMSYADIVAETGSKDLSAVFRLKHWAEIIAYYSSQGPGTLLFGYGARYSMVFTTEGLMPHSDMIRVLCELGAVLFSLFLYLYYSLYRHLRCNHLKVALLLVVLYYFSENLIDNFISMYLLHLMVGVKDYEDDYG